MRDRKQGILPRNHRRVAVIRKFPNESDRQLLYRLVHTSAFVL